MTEEKFVNWVIDVMYETRKNKRYGRDSIDFESEWVPRLRRMARQLYHMYFRVERNYTFVTPTPKWREIFATYFEGRMADNIVCVPLSKYLERELHPRTFNNRIGMGSMAAINQVIEDITEVSQGYTHPCRIIKWDLKGFFPNANLDYMEGCFARLIEKYADEITADFDDNDMPEFLKWLAMIVIHCRPQEHCERRSPKHLWDEHIDPSKSLFSKRPGIGAPIGRRTSQEGMGLYLNDEVRWLNNECGIRSTLFMDDCVMVVPERLHGYALSLLPVLRKRLATKGVRMNERKFYDQPYQHGLEFLGTHIRPWAIHLNNGTYSRGTERIHEYNAIDDDDERYAQIDRFISTVNSYGGMLKNHTDFRRLLALRDTIDDVWWKWLRWDSRRLCVVCEEGYARRDRLNLKYNLHLKNASKPQTTI